MVLPLLVLLLVMAIDFGRVFFGWVALQNTARIGADFAAQNWKAWPSDPSPPSVQARANFQTVMTNDLRDANCAYPSPLPDPVFEDLDADGIGWGDLAHVSITCDFALITPLAQSILGGPVTLSASSTFALHGTASGSIPSAPPIPCQDAEAVLNSTPPASGAGRISINSSDLTVTFTDGTVYTSECPLDVRTWKVNPGTATSSDEEWEHTFPAHTGSGFTDYIVTLTVELDHGSDTDTVTVRVRQ